MSEVTVVIPSLPEVDRHYLKLCVESLRATVDWDIIVVTNGGPHMNPLYDVDIQGITKHHHTKQQGQCNAANRGAESTEGNCKWLFIVNSDMYFAPNWNKKLRFDYPVFSPNLVEPTNNPGSAKPFLKRDWGFTLDEFKQQRADEGIIHTINSIKPKVGTYDEAQPTEETGFNLPFFVRRDVWQVIGGYDEKYDPWGSNSDTDLQTKFNLAGITPMRLRDVLVYHFSNKSGTFDGSHQEEWQSNWDYFNRKWRFNRDVLGSDVWYNKDMLPEDKDSINYQPDWVGKYADS